MCIDPVTAAVVGSAALSAVGAVQQGQAAKSSGDYNAQVAEGNAKIATQNAVWAGQAGEQRAANKELENRNNAGNMLASEGASGININSGSFQKTRATQDEIGQLDAMTIRSNAAKEAYGYVTQSTSDKNQASLDKTQGKNAQTASYLNAGSSLLSGGADAYSNYQGSKSLGSTWINPDLVE